MGVNNLWSGYDRMWLSFVLPSIQAVLRDIPLCWITFFLWDHLIRFYGMESYRVKTLGAENTTLEQTA